MLNDRKQGGSESRQLDLALILLLFNDVLCSTPPILNGCCGCHEGWMGGCGCCGCYVCHVNVLKKVENGERYESALSTAE